MVDCQTLFLFFYFIHLFLFFCHEIKSNPDLFIYSIYLCFYVLFIFLTNLIMFYQNIMTQSFGENNRLLLALGIDTIFFFPP